MPNWNEPKPVILTIDDEQAIRTSIKLYLEDYDYHVIEAEDGAIGLQVFNEKRPDLVLVDLRMPNMDGLEVLKAIKQQSPDTPVIVISGTGIIDDVVQALRQGAWNFLLKPLSDMNILVHAVEYALDRKRLMKKNKEYQENLEAKVVERTQELAKHKEHLEELVEERTKKLQEANDALHQSLNELKEMQARLVESEKMASLGNLVAGVAHEINTPVGIGVTAASHMQEKIRAFMALYDKGDASHSDLETFVRKTGESTQMILSNLSRAADLIRSFKQVAVDQSTETSRFFNVNDYLHELFLSLKPKFKKKPVRYSIHCPEDLSITGYPGALSQIVTNFVVNSLTHGFDTVDNGEITLRVFTEQDNIKLICEDNGKGMPEDICEHVFEPFFTTKRGRGGTGLGMHMVYNIVTQTLDGSIHCHSELGSGTRFEVVFPAQQGIDA